MNEFRERLLSGRPLRDPLLREKSVKGGSSPAEPIDTDGKPGLDGLVIPRDAPRLTDHRDGNRHRLLRQEEAVATWDGRDFRIEVVNLSGGGAMIDVPFAPRLWDRIDLSFGGCGSVECAVRWLKDGRIGVEFAHETRIDAEPEVRTALLREVVRRSFPDAEIDPPAPPAPNPDIAGEGNSAETIERSEKRHPLIWTGQIHFNHDSTPVRLRNISAVGALIEASRTFPIGAELLLDLGEAGSVFCTVAWAHGDQSGLRFHSTFNLALLARATPDVAPRNWAKPDYLRDDSTETSPWASRWNRLTVSELRQTLGR